eukprot:TRINITY_DN8356_c0_g1_i5.p1 TRINITY_DN8356_c0_g1~~TRINITY_DN8356_c0_g1_i5.p1  ORF type:complete len:490 (-),score=107.22 TRINITY_DN8356_c0_g1_i5:85-1554(-)
MDEYAVLDEDEVFIQLRNEKNPACSNIVRIIVRDERTKLDIENYIKSHQGERFIKKPELYEIEIESYMMLTKNPCLHPGDIRVVKSIKGVEKFIALRHLMNTIVFPQKGDVPITCQIAGSDLDGDLFFLTWDKRCIPSHVEKPFKYDAIPPKKGGPFKKDDMAEFFVKFMLYSYLGRIDNAHLALGDMDPTKFAKNDKCIKLFELHALAIDFAKTDFDIDEDEIPKVTEWPDFMEKQDEDYKTRKSETVLGRLYRMAHEKEQRFFDTVLSEKSISPNLKFIPEWIHCKDDFQQTFADYLSEAFLLWEEYQTEIGKIIKLFGTANEFELFTGNFVEIFRDPKKKKSEDQNLKNRVFLYVQELITKFRARFNSDVNVDFDMADDDSFKQSIKLQEKAQLKASIWYVVSYANLDNDPKLVRSEQEAKAQNKLEQWLGRSANILNDFKQQMIFQTAQSKRFLGLPWFVVSRILFLIPTIRSEQRIQSQDAREE